MGVLGDKIGERVVRWTNCMGFQDLLAWNGGFGGQNRGRAGGAMLTPNELVLPFGGSYVCAIWVKIDQEIRPSECSQTDRQTDWLTDTLTDANRFYTLPHAICYSMGQIKMLQDAQLSQRDRAAGCITVFAKSRRLELGDNILRTL